MKLRSSTPKSRLAKLLDTVLYDILKIPKPNPEYQQTSNEVMDDILSALLNAIKNYVKYFNKVEFDIGHSKIGYGEIKNGYYIEVSYLFLGIYLEFEHNCIDIPYNENKPTWLVICFGDDVSQIRPNQIYHNCHVVMKGKSKCTIAPYDIDENSIDHSNYYDLFESDMRQLFQQE